MFDDYRSYSLAPRPDYAKVKINKNPQERTGAGRTIWIIVVGTILALVAVKLVNNMLRGTSIYASIEWLTNVGFLVMFILSIVGLWKKNILRTYACAILDFLDLIF